MRKIMLNRVLPRSIEVKGHIEDDSTCKKAFEFFCKMLKTEKKIYAVDDTIEEYKVCVRVEEREEENKFTPNKKTIHVYITKKEHS